MKLFHLADLHLGKRVNGFSMVEDQRHILAQILDMARQERPQAVLIAGDVYDKSVPSAEAVELLDWFLVELTKLGLQVLLIAGNHDSAERLAFGGRLLDRSGVYVSPVYDGSVQMVELTDEYGPVRVYLLPFLKPVHVRKAWPEAQIETYHDAVVEAVAHIELDPALRNILVTHQFVAGSIRCESEELSVGGTDQVSAVVFEPFDYVALGHLHSPQQAGRETVRYAGSPLKYSFSEAKHIKSITVVELGTKGNVSLHTIALRPRRELLELRGSYEELTCRDFYAGTGYQDAYVHLTLTDEEDIPNAMGRLRVIYPYLMKLDYDNCRTRSAGQLEDLRAAEEKTPLELFSTLFSMQNGRDMSEQQTAYLQQMIDTIWEEAL